jgi:predicted metal-dependent peptidase
MNTSPTWVYDIHKKLADSILEMATDDRGTHRGMPFYSFTLMGFNFKESDKIPTAGVSISARGINYHYNPKFIDKLPASQIAFLNIHELFHILLNHHKRESASFYNHHLANVAQDMIINQSIIDDIMNGETKVDYLKSGIEMISEEVEIEDDKGNKTTEKRNTAWLVPKEYKGELIFEELYAWLWKEYKKHQQKQQQEQQQGGGKKGKGQSSQKGGQGQGQQEKSNGQDQDNQGGQEGEEQGEGEGSGEQTWKKGDYGKYDKGGHGNYSLDALFDGIDKNEQMTIDSHLPDECSQEMKDQIVEDMLTKARNRGLVSANHEQFLSKLRPPRKNYLSLIRKAISSQLFGSEKQTTIRKANRRGIEGLKGYKKISYAINVILDTSGSMSGEFEKALSYVYQSEVSLNLIQCDAQVHCKTNIKNKSDFNKFKIQGLGGTSLQPAIEYLIDNKMDKMNTLILTDGYTDTLEFERLKGKVLILSTSVHCPIGSGKEKVKSIIIDKED